MPKEVPLPHGTVQDHVSVNIAVEPDACGFGGLSGVEYEWGEEGTRFTCTGVEAGTLNADEQSNRLRLMHNATLVINKPQQTYHHATIAAVTPGMGAWRTCDHTTSQGTVCVIQGYVNPVIVRTTPSHPPWP